MFSLVVFRSCVKIDSVDMLKFTHTHKLNKFGFQFNRFLDFEYTYIWFSWIDRIKTRLHGLMYIRLDLYTYMLHIFRKTYFDSIFSWKSCICIFEIQKPVKLKTKHIELVCVCELEHIKIFTRELNRTKLNTNQSLLVKLLSKLTRSKIRSNELDSNWVLNAILMCELLNQHVLAPKLLFWS